MLKALVLKELRETAGIVAIALAFYFCLTVRAMRHDLLPWLSLGNADYLNGIPFVAGSHLSSFVWVSAGFAIALGFRQSLGESLRGTWTFMLHRPISRTRLIGVKLLAGAAVYLACAAAAVLAYAWSAATPGTHASPFEWSMTAPTWKVWITMPLLYLGAFVSGIRPARWAGSRLLPLVATGVLAALVPGIPCWPVFGVGSIALLSLVLVGSILFVVRTRDF